MDNFSTIFPRRQGQDLEIRPSWAPVTPARRFGNAPASGGAGLVRGDDGGGIRGGSVADGTGVEPGLMSFGGNSQQDLSFRELMQDLSGREVAGPVRPKISHFMQGWRQSFPNVAVPSSPAVGSRQVAGPPDQLLLNGSFLLVSGHAQPVPKSSAGGYFFPSIPNLNFSPERRAATGLEMSRMVPCPATPATLDKGRRVPDRLPREIVDLTGETMITLNNEEAVVVHQSQIENHIDTCFTRQTVTEPAEGKCTVGSSEEPSGQQLEAEKQDTAENAGIDLNKTPPQKPKRKKHRPKVIREDRPARKPKSATPRTVIQRAAKNNVTPTGKRKYVRKKKVENALDTPTEAVGENIDPRGGGSGVKKSVRRCLNFESEHLAGDGCPGSSTSRLACNAESSELQSRGTSTGNRSDGYTDKSTAQVSGGQNVGMNFIDGVPFDLNHWKNPIQAGIVNIDSSTSCALYQGRGQASVQYMQGEHSGMSEILNPPYHQPSRREMIRENLNNLAKHTECVNVTNNMQNSLMNLLYGRAKRDHNHIGAAPVSTHTNFINAYEINQIRNFHETSANAPDLTDNNKKRRVEEQNELMSKTSSVRSCLVPCTPSRSWNLNQVSQPSPNAFTFSEALHLMAPEKLRDSARMLAFGHTDGDTSNGSNILGQAQNSASMTSTIDCSQLFTPEKPFGDGNLNHKLYSSPETLSSNYNCRQEDEICRPPILTEDTVTKSHPKPKRGRKPKKDRALADNSTSTNASGMRVHGPKTQNHSSSRRKSVRATPLGAEECQEKQSHSSQISTVQDCYSSSDLHESVYSSITSQAIVSYRDPMDDIIQKLQHLSINNVHEDVIAEAQNALVQYNGGNMLVPYEDVTRKRRSRPKVDLDPETNRVWRLLMLKDTIDGDAELDKDKAKWWKEERRVFRGRVDSFIARMHLVQGDRTFSPWKGSVVDSVVGVFLTQNVSDHLSSSAFMSLAAKFPLKSIQPDTEKASASFKQEGCIFSIRETVKLQTEPQGQEYLDRSSIVTYEVEDSKAKQTANTQKSPGTRSQSGDGLVSNSKCEGTYFQGNVVQISNRSPGTQTDSSLTVLASISLLEGEDIRSPEDAASSQRSVISSQNSSDYPFQTVDQLGAFLDSSIESDDLAVGNMCYGLDNYTSFTELLKMAENTKFQKLYSHGSGLLSSTQYCGAIDQLASTGDENRKSVLDLLDNQNGACSSVVVPNDSNDAQCDFSVTSNPSTSYDFHGVSNAILAEKETYGLSSLALVNAMTNSRMDRQFMPLPRTHLVTTGQQGSVTAETCSLFDPCASDGKNNLQSLNGLVGENCFNKQHCCNNQLPSEKPRAMLGKSIPQSATQSQGGPAAKDQPKGGEANIEREKSQPASEAQPKIANSKVNEFPPNLENKAKQSNPIMEAAQSNSKPDVASSNDTPEGMAINGPKQRRGKSDVEKNKSFDWDSLRKQAYCNGPPKGRRSDRLDSLDWEAVRCADVSKISDTIRERGMNNMLAERIKEFLNRLVREHGSIDLEWLRDVPPDKAKEYLLSIRGLGLKSVECVRLLTLHHLAFPVDTNVGRISVRLGWVPLQPLPESLQLHLLELYPVLETIQKYLWPRLCTLDQRTLYELHYQLITFGKVFCTKSKPNCNACPMRGECKHFASAFASARLALPGPEEKGIVSSLIPVAPENNQTPSCTPIPMLQLEGNMLSQGGKAVNNCEPIIEEPATPEPECIETSESAIEDTFDEDPDEIPTIKLNLEQFTQNLQNYMQENNFEIQEGDMSKALVLLAPEAASIPMPKLKNVSRLRTEHQVYELPDSHPLLEGLDRRDPDDPCSYLLAIWTPGETAESTEPPEICCNSQDTGRLCNRITCFTCNSVREAQTQMIRGTLLIPCRTAMRGSFPLNGTYFQVNEVFADHESSHNPINVPRKWIWNLPRRTVYFGTSIPTIFRGLSTEGIQHCFWRGYVCVRGFDRMTRAPRPLFRRLHSPASKIIRSKKAAAASNKDE